jgi:hypothetical protein
MTLKELIKQHLTKSGIEEAVAVRVTLNSGETLLISSDSHPALEREVGEGRGTKVTLMQSAQAGLSNGIVARQRRERLILEPEAMAELMENSENDLFGA